MIVSNIEEGCNLCLHYFGIFRYPLTAEEIHLFNPYPAKQGDVETALTKLADDGKIFRKDVYFLKKDDEAWVPEREAGYSRAMDLLEKSRKYTAIIASFPFVRGIAISGSLSKFYASESPDLDFFIITARNRLWIARTLLHMFKKLTFITGHQHYFCMNYLIDTDALLIEHPNLYSAIEVKTLLPAYNKVINDQFSSANAWTNDYLPNHPGTQNPDYLISGRKRIVKGLFESIINIFAPERLNRFFMKLTDSRWRRKWLSAGYSPEAYDRAFRTTLHISKNHPDDYEKQVMDALPDKITVDEQ